MQNKEWGAILTWKYTEHPYLGSGAELYDQMMTAYQAGAKYVIIFNYPEIPGNPYWTMTDDHFAAVEKFSRDIMDTYTIRTRTDAREADAVLVLPENYAWVARDPTDKIWATIRPTKIRPNMEHNLSTTITVPTKTDIIYEDPDFPVAGKYPKIYYWNQTLC